MSVRSLSILVALLCVFGIVSAQEGACVNPSGADGDQVDGESKPSHDRTLDTLALKETRECLYTAKVPTEYISEQRHKRVAASRLSVDLDRGSGVLELEYEGESTQTPIIAAFFNDQESESYLSAKAYRERKDRSALVAFTVKSTPRNFGAYTTILEHAHVNESGQVTIKSIPFHNLETFDEQKVTITGLLPGVNCLKLRVQYTGSTGVTTTSEGVSHFVRVDEVPALELTTETSVSATHREIGTTTAYRSSTTTEHRFMLSPAIEASSIEVRVLREGERLVNLGGLAPGLRAVVGLAPTSRSAELIHQFKLDDLEADGVRVRSLANRRYVIEVDHVLAVSESLLPVRDSWKYIIELRHKRYAEPIDRFVHVVGAELNGEQAVVNWRNGNESQELQQESFTASSQ